jgi:hypothetical protein
VHIRPELQCALLLSAGPKHIDSFYTSSDGIWYPDHLGLNMGWQGSGASADAALSLPPSFFNPFLPVDPHLVVLASTEKLQAAEAPLQWAMHQEGSRRATPADRGNLGIAQQNLKPSWLSKPGYLQFCSLRSYPLGQLRRLCVILKERSMPFGHHAVQTLLQQTLYQIGPLDTATGDSGRSSSSSSNYSTADGLTLLWRAGWDESVTSVLPTLAAELQQLADALDQTPREHDAVLLLGQVAAYLADWCPDCKAVARRFAAMTSRVADELQQQIDALATGQEEVAAKLQAKQCKARMMALLCYVAGALDTEDVGHMLGLMVLVKHGDLFLEDAGLAAELAGLRALCHNVIARRLPEVLAVLKNQKQRISLLTSAVTLVLQRTPSNLHWQQLTAPSFATGTASGSFEAVGGDGHLYSINILDGTVLLDGAPPSRLPLEILQHPLYVRTFGDCNFEVAVTKQGVRQTIKPIKGRFYDFYLADGGQASELVVVEVDKDRGQRLQLLDVGVDGKCGEWGKELPVRLRRLYSHWLSRYAHVSFRSLSRMSAS